MRPKTRSMNGTRGQPIRLKGEVVRTSDLVDREDVDTVDLVDSTNDIRHSHTHTIIGYILVEFFELCWNDDNDRLASSVTPPSGSPLPARKGKLRSPMGGEKRTGWVGRSHEHPPLSHLARWEGEWLGSRPGRTLMIVLEDGRKGVGWP